MANISNFNEFQRKLEGMNLDDRQKYFFTVIKEELNAVNEEMASAAKAILALAEQMEMFVELHGRTQQGLQAIRKGIYEERGIDVMSVATEPETEQ